MCTDVNFLFVEIDVSSTSVEALLPAPPGDHALGAASLSWPAISLSLGPPSTRGGQHLYSGLGKASLGSVFVLRICGFQESYCLLGSFCFRVGRVEEMVECSRMSVLDDPTA